MDKVFLCFTDECGSYQTTRSDAFLKAHPFYVRANVLMSIIDYIAFKDEMNTIKEEFWIKTIYRSKMGTFWEHFKRKK